MLNDQLIDYILRSHDFLFIDCYVYRKVSIELQMDKFLNAVVIQET